MKAFVIAIDGPAASGKGTLAKQIAQTYGLHHLDTGLGYRAVAYAMLNQSLLLNDEEAAIAIARLLDFDSLNRDSLSDHRVGEAASQVAVMPRLRQVLVEKQRQYTKTFPGAVLDGRDIASVVCPDADVKLYVTASAQARAERRYHEILSKGEGGQLYDILEDIKKRDQRDMNRNIDPLTLAKDARLLDTTKLSIEAAFAAARSFIDPIFKAHIR